IINDAETSFFPNDLAFPGGNDRVNQFEQIFSWLFMIDVHDDDALGHADLHGGQTDAWSVIHGDHHIINEAHKIIVDIGDSLTALFQAGIRVMQDWSNHLLDL